VELLRDAEVVFPALHGGWGEDGTIQAVLELAGIPCAGSGVAASALAMDKERSKRIFRDAGIPTPPGGALTVHPGTPPDAEELARAAAAAGSPDLVVKPAREGSTVGLTLVKDGQGLADAVTRAGLCGDRVLVERFIPGRELTVGVLEGRALPVVEIVPEGGLYTYEAKYTGGKSEYLAPAPLGSDEAGKLAQAGERAFAALGCEGFGRADFRLSPDGGIWCLEVNTLPGMTGLSLVPMAAAADGISFEELVERIVEDAIRRAGQTPSATTGGGV
jgi:D-alanine-D-alanine ligase